MTMPETPETPALKLPPTRYRCRKCGEIRTFIGITIKRTEGDDPSTWIEKDFCASCFEALMERECGQVDAVDEEAAQ